MYEKTGKIWLDGKLIPWKEANVHIMTHSLHYGVGVFEGIRYYDCGAKGSAVFRLTEHMQRMGESAKIMAMKMPYTVKETVSAVLETVRVNGLKEGYIRPLAFISDEPNAGVWAYDNPVRMGIMTYGWGAYLGKEGVEKGIRTRVSSYTRHHRNIGMTKAKVTGQYFNSVLAKREAKLAGCDEAIMLDTEGFVAEGTGENIFVVRNNVVRTPMPGAILQGITRNTIMTLLKEDGVEVREDVITRDDLYTADEVFLTGTAAEVTPVREVDHRDVGTGTPGPITRKLQKMYSTLVRGGDPRHQAWLTFVQS
ncbi:MAG: branched-chain amino acid transaminase [Pseudomonadota bacterium]